MLKGGVASGLLYAGALPELARRHRFRGVAGASAGAIAAAFAAAAEYARQHGDPEGFSRMTAICEALPGRLISLLQPSPPFRRLMRALVAVAPGSGKARWGAAVGVFWPVFVAGALASLTLLAADLVIAAPDGPGDLALLLPLAAVVALIGGMVAWVGHIAWLVFRVAPDWNFGICGGRGQVGSPALSDWIHESLQTIAFGPDAAAFPLTFGDLAACGVDLRLVTTDLGHAVARTLPDLPAGATFDPLRWSRLFAPAVLAAMSGGRTTPAPAPEPAAWPVAAAVRISLSCPVLMEAVPLRMADGELTWLSDGGVTLNFPIRLFEDSPLPTIGLDLGVLEDPAGARITRLRAGDEGPPARLGGTAAFAWAILSAMREGHLRAELPQTERIRVWQARLTRDQGGMNLDMSREAADRLVALGRELGRRAGEGDA